MATTATDVAVRQALIALLAARPGLAGIQVVYAHPGQAIRSEAIYTRNARVESPIAALRAGRKTRDETVRLEVVVDVLGPGDDQATVDTRAAALGAELENLLADDITCLSASGAFEAWVEGYTADGGIEGESRRAVRVYTVLYHARLT